MKKLKSFFLAVVFVFGLLFVYFIKCQLDITFIKHFPFDKFPPLSLLQNRNPHHIVYDPEAGINLLLNRFPFLSGVGIWGNLWMQDEGMVTLGPDPTVYNSSSSLVIISRSKKGWALGQKKLFEVNPGEVFNFSGWVKTSGQAFGKISVILYDADRRPKKWDYAQEIVAKPDHWQKIEREFTIPFGVTYIELLLSGKGEGKVWFDKIKFMKE